MAFVCYISLRCEVVVLARSRVLLTFRDVSAISMCKWTRRLRARAW